MGSPWNEVPKCTRKQNIEKKAIFHDGHLEFQDGHNRYVYETGNDR